MTQYMKSDTMPKPMQFHSRVKTTGDYQLRDYLENCAPSFIQKLFDLIFVSDSNNLALLRKVFPQQVEAARLWRTDDDYVEFIKGL